MGWTGWQVAVDPKRGCMQGKILQSRQGREMSTVLFNGGGGFSLHFDMPEYQRDAVQAYIESDRGPPLGSYNASNRGFPDIAALGWYYLIIDKVRLPGVVSTIISQAQFEIIRELLYYYYYQGAPSYVGGTSASAPALAGMIAQLNEELLAVGEPPMGFLNPFLYKLAEERPEAFHKVVKHVDIQLPTHLPTYLFPSFQVYTCYYPLIAICDRFHVIYLMVAGFP